MQMMRWTIYVSLLLFCLNCSPAKPDAIVEAEKNLPEVVDYNYHIKPIISDRCYKCHGPDDNTREADLRFDVEEAAKAKLAETGNRALVPGSLRKSEVFYRLVSDDPDVMMPPPESNLHITDEEKAYILKWIEQGADYKTHWSFIPPERHKIEQGKDDWGINEVDHFILARLKQEGLMPAKEASKETLIRRLALDLTGLPPTLEEIDAFLADDSPDAYQRVVDQLLASDAYGERMAAEWMDLSRYADSHGYQDDGMRNMWPWRDWVIKSFNANQPFDDFLTWQLAGDLLPNPTTEQILATGFNRNHMQSQEGGVVSEEYRVEYVADRTNTLGKAFMGLSMECARCHDHKFDPISQKEYYQMFGYFNSINEIGVIPYAGEASPTVILPSEQAKKELVELDALMQPLEEKIQIDHPDYDAAYAQWGKGLNGLSKITIKDLIGYYPLDEMAALKIANHARRNKPATIQGDKELPVQFVDGKIGKAIELNGESWFAADKEEYAFERNDAFSLSLWVNLQKDSLSGALIGRSYSLFDGNRGYMLILNEDGTLSASLNHVAPDNSIEIQTSTPFPIKSWQHLVMTYDGSSRAGGLKLYLNGALIKTKIVVDRLQKSVLYTHNFYRDKKTNWTGDPSLRLGMIGPNQTRIEHVLVDDLHIYSATLTSLEIQQLSGTENPLGAIASRHSDDWTEEQEKALRSYYVTRLDRQYQRTADELSRLRGEQNAIITPQQEVMVMRERKEPRPTYILDRGAYDARMEEVVPGTPAVLPAFLEDQEQNRLGLAKWLTDPAHPLTARVTVNRYWQQLFGKGLVATPDDFGSQGSLPSHPELLDWLAVEFAESGWDVKGILKKIAMSATYRQSSIAPADLLERDPGNMLLARGPSYRMTAEMIRDNALAVSGLLIQKTGGPSVHPYQPAGLWKQLATRNETEYKQDEGDGLYRRSMYTVWKRSAPPPSMISFDASERSFCIVERQKTSSPLQALVLLNDPQYVEAARLLAERMMKEGGSTIEEQIVFAFRLLTSRYPEPHEKELLTHLYAEEQKVFVADKEEAKALLAVGEYPRDPSLDEAEVAARTVVASTILNFDEAYMKR
ncbi:MAG: DUF1553 domain-containing protein [Rhodothermales bacterium]